MGGFASKRYSQNSRVRLDGKIAVITGANAGIGKQCTKDFYLRGAKVIMACRNLEKCTEALDEIKEEFRELPNLGSLHAIKLDLSSLESVSECAKIISNFNSKIDILLNNAGIMACPFQRTIDGFEMQFGTNHLGHFLFTLLLLPKLQVSDAQPARIVNVSSLAYINGKLDFADLNYEKKSYDPMDAYRQSKLANILFTKELAKRLQDADLQDVIHTYTLHPGIINTELLKDIDDSFFKACLCLIRPFFKTPLQGAQTSIYCSISEEAKNETGCYYSGCKKAAFFGANNMVNASKLWTESLKLCGLPNDFDPFVNESQKNHL